MIRRAATLCLLLSFIIQGCDSNGTGPDKDEIVSVSITPSSSIVEIGNTVQLTAQALNSSGAFLDASFSWSSSDDAIATSSGTGLVAGVTEGTVTITATAEGVSGTASILVVDLTEPAPPSGVGVTALSNTVVDVTWVDNSTNEDEFRIDREAAPPAAPGGGDGPLRVFEEIGIVGADVTTFRDTGLTSGTAYRYRIRACNQNGCSAPEANEGEVTTFAELIIETTALDDGSIGQTYDAALSATATDGSEAWSIVSGDLPPGISFSSAGVLSGTPTLAGTFDFTVQVSWGGQVASQELSLGIQAVLTVITTSLPNGVTGTSYGASLEASGGDGTYAWSVVAGVLPDGLALDPGGTISGTPTGQGSSLFTVQVASAGETLVIDFSINVYHPLAITSESLLDGKVGTAYSQTVSASGGSGVYSWSVLVGTLPDGLALDPSSGTISGIPTAEGTSDVTLQVASAGLTAVKEFSISITPALSVTTTSLPNARVGIIYNFFLDADGGDGNFTWSVVAGVFPGGLNLHSGSGVISGTPNTAGIFPFTIQVASAGLTATADLTLGVYEFLVVTTTSLPDGQFGQPYSATFTASGGDGAYTWDLSGGTLPQGLSLGADGVVSGTPTWRGTFNLTVRVRSGDGQATFKSLSITIN
ncbi:MAG: hypothetical protein HKO65_19705 [Gemmatimonadetes bacterium]|nr:putative Ig domain-containing protein [Gemmatimonadota bacterium]NNM07329.1 hypothetical protein [Gemmatimonadota bacterium]